MYHCYIHNWASRNESCPKCVVYKTSASNNSTLIETSSLQTQVSLLERKVKVLSEALELIAAPHLGEHLDSYFKGIHSGDVLKCCITDATIAREALKEVGE